MYLKKLKLKKYLLFIFATFLVAALFGCAPRKAIKEELPKNVDLIIKSIKELDLSDKVKSGENIALVSIEFGQPTDFPVNYLIEDELIQKMYETGITILERDGDVLRNLIAESEGKYQYLHKINPDSIYVLRTNLTAANKIIAYRVLECGVRFKAVGNSKKKAGEASFLKREAITVLHVRIEDPKTGIVKWVGDIKGEASDLVNSTEVSSLESKDLIFYEHGLPNINK
jgi:hypothetical protein